MLQIRKHGYFSDLEFIVVFVGILPFYAINLGAVSLFTDSPFTFLSKLNMLFYLLYFINLNKRISFFLVKQKKTSKKINWFYAGPALRSIL